MSKAMYALGRLSEFLHYDPDTGIFVWLQQRGNKKPGDIAGTKHKHGYTQINFDGVFYLAHRLAWALVHGEFPEVIDHINGVKSDNRLINLRAATPRLNMENIRRARCSNLSGLLGAHTNKHGTFDAKIQVRGKCIYLGRFPTANEAHAAYVNAKRKLHEGSTL